MNKENKIPILGLLPEEIADKIEAPKSRAEQIFRWLHQRKVKTQIDHFCYNYPHDK